MERLARNGLDGDEMNLNNCNITSLSSELSFSPYLAKLFLQENNSLTMIPPYFFQHIPVLQVLDLSRTSIQSLPPSISRLYLLEKLILQDCTLLMEVPPEVGALKRLKLFDLEGTELMYLPEQVGNLETLEYLRVSLSACADDQKDRYGIQYIIPRMMISKLSKLKELSISVDPEAEWWEVELLEAIMGDLPFLPEIKILKLYFPTAKALQQFLRLERFRVPIFSSLWNYRFMIGHCEQLPFSVQLDMEESFLKLEKCVKYMNGEGYTNETAELIRDAEALYLRRHWNAEKLLVFDTRRLKYCLLMECNELQTLVDHGDLYIHENSSTSHSEDEILGSLEFLSIHFMKKLQRISKGRIGRNSLSCLRILALHTCPKLTSIFTGCLLGNMQSLTELIVEDCPEVKCLVDLGEVNPWSNGPFLVSLRKVSLIDLPELVSISDGVSIAPQLDTLLIFNCMKLNYLSDMEISSGTKVIKGEIEWWDALKHGKLSWQNVFVPLKRDGGLMDQLAEDTNSLKHFLDLEMIPSHHGCNYESIKEDLEHVDPVHTDSLPSSNEIQKTEDTDYDKKAVNHHLDSAVKSYYRCTGCEAEKQIERSDDDPSTWENYGIHTCLSLSLASDYTRATESALSIPSFSPASDYKSATKLALSIPNLSLASDYTGATKSASSIPYLSLASDYTGATESALTISKNSGHLYMTRISVSSTPAESSSTITDNSFGVHLTKKKHRIKWSIRVPAISNKLEDIPPDEYSWRKYGQKLIKGSPHPRVYYRCISIRGCPAKKYVERSLEDLTMLIVTYSNEHNHSKAYSEMHTSTITDNSFGLDSTKKMSGSASIPRWKQQADMIRSRIFPSIQIPPSSSIPSKPNIIISEVAENSSTDLPSPKKTAQNVKEKKHGLDGQNN
uniref:uncharacterized protein LOC122596627 isoform X2 n=1 Tax=Erigeron canadensis TaxID=72917 RepID=UPI001CB905D3|nr:uncharacterized protein LOC122596627 isoform X2 [Erigeron canadensis]